ncbi:ChbG/HpnK family deacetylase [Paenibacillus rhizoplanae]
MQKNLSRWRFFYDKQIRFFSSDDRLLIINADDFGITKGTNEAIVSLFEQQAITSTSIMFPCPAAREAIELSNQKKS